MKVKDFLKYVRPEKSYHLVEKNEKGEWICHWSDYQNKDRTEQLLKRFGNREVEWFDCEWYCGNNIAIMMKDKKL